MNTLDRLRVISGLISVTQTVPILAAFLGIAIDAPGLVVVAAAANVLLELLDYALARRAGPLIPPGAAAKAFALRPLTAANRRVVILNIVGGIVACALLVLMMPANRFRGEKWLEMLVLLAVAAPIWLSQLRVLKNNSWAALPRIPRQLGADAKP